MTALVRYKTAKPLSSVSDTIAAEINAEHEQATAAIAAGTAHAIRAGELLIQAKDEFGHHGQWLKWQHANLSFSVRTAQVYMQLAKLDPEKRNSVAHLALRRAVLKLQQHERAEYIRAGDKPEPKPPSPTKQAKQKAEGLCRQLLDCERHGIPLDIMVKALCRAFDLMPRPRVTVLIPRAAHRA